MLRLFLALTLAITILALRPTLASSWYQNLGYLHLSRALLAQEPGAEELASAHLSFTHAVSWQDHNSRARWGLGEVYHQLGDDVAAVKQWQRTEGALPCLLGASDAAFKAEDYSEALDQVLLAVEVEPNSSSAHYRLGQAYRGLGQLDRGLSEYQRAKELNSFLPGDTADLASCYFGEARVYAAQENWDAAVWHYEVGLELRPDAQIHASLSDIYRYRVRDLAGAASHVQQAIALEPTEPWWHVSLAAIYLDQEKYDHALHELQAAILIEDSLTQIPDVQIELGRAYYGLGQYHNAVQAYEQALANDPDNGSAQEGLEQALRSLHGETGRGG